MALVFNYYNVDRCFCIFYLIDSFFFDRKRYWLVFFMICFLKYFVLKDFRSLLFKFNKSFGQFFSLKQISVTVLLTIFPLPKKCIFSQSLEKIINLLLGSYLSWMIEFHILKFVLFIIKYVCYKNSSCHHSSDA